MSEEEFIHQPAGSVVPKYLLGVSHVPNQSVPLDANENDFLQTSSRNIIENMRMHSNVRDYLEKGVQQQSINPFDPRVQAMRHSYKVDVLPFRSKPPFYEVALDLLIKQYLGPYLSTEPPPKIQNHTQSNCAKKSIILSSTSPSDAYAQPSVVNVIKQNVESKTTTTPSLNQINETLLPQREVKNVIRPPPPNPVNFTFFEEALESLGPNVKSVRSGTRPWFLSGVSITNENSFQCKEYVCFRGKQFCPAQFWIVYDFPDMPWKVCLYSEKHHDHKCNTWQEFYEYSICFHNNKDPKWDKKKFPAMPGLPPTIVRTADHHAEVADRALNITRVAIGIIDSVIQNYPFLINATIREKMKHQIVDRIRNQRNKKKAGRMAALGNPKAEVAGDISLFIKKFRINFAKLPPTWTADSNITGELHLEELARSLHYFKVINPLPSLDKNGQLGFLSHALIVLDEDQVSNHPRWDFLHTSRESSHRTGPNTRGRTIVFSSIALLGNFISCQNLQWDVCACVDGTANLSDTKYVLLAFGFNARKKDGNRTFVPFAFAWGEAEREIVALHLFLNVKAAVVRLFGIQNIQFNGGFVTDNASAFHNAVQHAFPNTQQLDCYTHIIRKFKVKDKRKGNGVYYKDYWTGEKNIDSIEWMHDVAHSDIRNLSFCMTEEQQLLYWKKCLKPWAQKGQLRMYHIFNDSYMSNSITRSFRYNSGPLPCHPPDGNPHESFFLQVKGYQHFVGMLSRTGLDMSTVLFTEFPRIVKECSEYKTSVKDYYPLDNPLFAFEQETFRTYYELFMRHKTVGITNNINVREYKNGWLVNDTNRLGKPITDEVVSTYEKARYGILELTSEERSILVQSTEDLHHITRAADNTLHIKKESRPILHCSCRDYCYKLYCHPVAIMQHHNYFELNMQQLKSRKKLKKMDKEKHEKYRLSIVSDRMDMEDIIKQMKRGTEQTKKALVQTWDEEVVLPITQEEEK